MSEQQTEGEGITRLSFLKPSAGAVAGAAAISLPGAAALASEEGGVPTDPASASNPPEPVMAYVRDAERGEVTVIAGTSETTYRDRALTRRLLKAAPSTAKGGDNDVLAP